MEETNTTQEVELMPFQTFKQKMEEGAEYCDNIIRGDGTYFPI